MIDQRSRSTTHSWLQAWKSKTNSNCGLPWIHHRVIMYAAVITQPNWLIVCLVAAVKRVDWIYNYYIILITSASDAETFKQSHYLRVNSSTLSSHPLHLQENSINTETTVTSITCIYYSASIFWLGYLFSHRLASSCHIKVYHAPNQPSKVTKYWFIQCNYATLLMQCQQKLT